MEMLRLTVSNAFHVITLYLCVNMVAMLLIDWVVDHGSIQNNSGDLALILTETNGGSRLSSTRYVHYGTITAKRGFHVASVPCD